MPRYKQPQKKVRPMHTWHPWLVRGLIIFGVLLFIGIATMVTKKIVSKIPPVYGSSVSDQLLSKRALITKVTKLETTLEGYDARLTTFAQLQAENDSLKAELGRTPAPTGVLANVLTLPNRSFYDTMNIDAGRAEGIEQNMTVYAFGSVALGTISSVDTHTATVALYSAPGHQMTGNAVGSDVAVTLIGRGGGEYEARLPRNVPFAVGAMIASQSTNVATLATVEKIVTDPRDPFQRLLAKAPINLQALKWVIVR
jgi:cell shape-determining protein MreC